MIRVHMILTNAVVLAALAMFLFLYMLAIGNPLTPGVMTISVNGFGEGVIEMSLLVVAIGCGVWNMTQELIG